MDLSSLTKKINESLNYTRDIGVAGVTYTLRLHSHDSQKAIEAYMVSISSLDRASEEWLLANKKISDMNITYALYAVDGEVFPEVFEGGLHKDKALLAWVGTIPHMITQILFSAVLDMKVEYATNIVSKVVYNWFGAPTKDLDADKKEIEELQKDDEEADRKRVEEEAKRAGDEEDAGGSII